MPIYEFACQNCKHEYEQLFTSFSESEREIPNATCPKCGSREKEKLLSSKTSFQLKGYGWAKDRYSGSRKK